MEYIHCKSHKIDEAVKIFREC